MKKLVCFLLVLVILGSLAACGGSEANVPAGTTDGSGTAGAETAGLRVGYSRLEIMPQESVPLGGYGNSDKRMSKGFDTYLYTTCIAYSDGEDTVLVFQNDLSGAHAKTVANLRASVEDKLGIPGDHVMVAHTHTHSAPDIYSTLPVMNTYRRQLEKTMLEAAEKAVGDLKPCTGMYHGTARVEGLNFVRHYTTTDPTVFKGDSLNYLDPNPVTGHLSEADNEMQVVRIDREGADSLVLINWQTHPHRGGSMTSYNLSADIVGIMRDHVEQNVPGVLFAYYTGASGNINPKSYIEELNITKDFKEQGNALGKYAVDVLGGEMTKPEGTDVKMTGQFYTAEINHSEDHLVETAKIVQAEWAANNDYAAATALANSYGFNSPYHASAIINRANFPETMDVEMYAFSVGDLGFVASSYEMFDKQGITIKESSPFAATFVITCANNSIGYIPDKQGFEINCYEANQCRFMPGMGETLAEEYVKMLESLYEAE